MTGVDGGDDDSDNHARSDAAGDGDNPDDRNDADSDGDDVRDDWRAALTAAGRLTPETVDAIVSAHEKRGHRAIEAVSESRVKQYRDFTVVVGYDDEYIVEAGQCTCKDAEYNLDQSNPAERCWHSLAVDIARALDEVDYHDMWYSEVREFL